MKAYIKYSWDKNIINPHGDSGQSSSSSNEHNAISEVDVPSDGWKSVMEAFSVTDIPQFNNGQILTYFVIRSVIDGLPLEDFNSVSSSAVYLFKCGHVQNIEVCFTPHHCTFELSVNLK